MSEIVLFWIISKWETERGICDEPRVRTRFRCYNPVVLCCTIVGHAIEEQQGFAVEIHSDSLLITNSYFVGHSWMGLAPILSYRHLYYCGI
jgi:hypothetical protein